MSFVVYWIREKSHTDLMTQGYIGVSGNVEQRFAAHRNMENGTNAHLRHAIQKHGWDNMVKSVLLMADKDYCLDIERQLRPSDKIGWNLTVGGGYPPVTSGPQPQRRGRASWNAGKTGIYSDEALEKMRQKKLGVSPTNKGKPLSDETKSKLSAALIGRVGPRLGAKLPPELIEQIAAKNRGKKRSDEVRAKMSLAMTGLKRSAPMSDEHKQKLGAIAKGKRWYNNGHNVVFCLDGLQPEGYTLGRKSIKLCKEK